MSHCIKCGGEMAEGIALVNTLWIHGDFIGDYSGPLRSYDDLKGCTMSMSGPPKIVKVSKCKDCGRSISTQAAFLDEGNIEIENENSNTKVDNKIPDELIGKVESCINGYYQILCFNAPDHLKTLNLSPQEMSGALVGDTVTLKYITSSSFGFWKLINIWRN